MRAARIKKIFWGPAGPPFFFAGTRVPAPTMRALRESMALPCSAPRVTFSPMRKSPKNLPEGRPLWVLPLGGIIIPPAARACMRLLLPPERGATPGSPQKPNPPAAPRIDSRGCAPRCSLGRNKDRLAHKLKVANRAGFVAEGSPARCVSEREKGGKGWL